MLKFKVSGSVPDNKWTDEEKLNLREGTVNLTSPAAVKGSGKFHFVNRPKFTMISLDAAGSVSGDNDIELKPAHLDDDGSATLAADLFVNVTRDLAVPKGETTIKTDLEGLVEFTLPGADSPTAVTTPGSGEVTVTADSEKDRVLSVDLKVKVCELVADDKNVNHAAKLTKGDFYIDAVLPFSCSCGAKPDKSVFTIRGANDHCAQCWKRMGDWSPVYIPVSQA